jgi:hypothetical protein
LTAAIRLSAPARLTTDGAQEAVGLADGVGRDRALGVQCGVVGRRPEGVGGRTDGGMIGRAGATGGRKDGGMGGRIAGGGPGRAQAWPAIRSAAATTTGTPIFAKC